jgi:hypothetical protein
MFFKSALLLAGSVFLYGQTPRTDAPRTRVEEAKDALLASRDAELLNSSVSLDDLTEEKATQMEEAARRQLDRAKANLERARTFVDAGLQPKQSLEAPTQELAAAQASYELTFSRTDLIHQLADMVRVEQESVESADSETSPAVGIPPVMERFDGAGSFTPADFNRVKRAFELQFHRTLPVSAEGETAVHRAMGYDHRNRVDVALFPDTPEGMWLRHYLEASAIPYYAFRSFVAGKATAAHIHIGPPSNRIPRG